MGEKQRLARERGKAFEREIGKSICKIWGVNYDKEVKRTPRSGAFKPEFEGDLWFAHWFKTILKEYVQECKNRNNINLKKWIRECEADFSKWMIHFKYKGWGNFSVMPTILLLNLVKRVDDLLEENINLKIGNEFLQALIPKKKIKIDRR